MEDDEHRREQAHGEHAGAPGGLSVRAPDESAGNVGDDDSRRAMFAALSGDWPARQDETEGAQKR